MCTLSKAAVPVPRLWVSLPWLPALNTPGHEGHVGMGMGHCHCSPRAVRAHCSGVSATQRQVQERCLPTQPSSHCPPSVPLLLSPHRTEIYKNHVIQLLDQSRADQKLQHVVKPLSKCLLDTDRPGALTMSLGSLFQCITTLSLKKHFLTTNLNVPWHTFEPFPHILSLDTREKRSAPSPPQEAVEHYHYCHLCASQINQSHVDCVKELSRRWCTKWFVVFFFFYFHGPSWKASVLFIVWRQNWVILFCFLPLHKRNDPKQWALPCAYPRQDHKKKKETIFAGSLLQPGIFRRSVHQ